VPEEQIDQMIDSGDAETIFQKAVMEQVRFSTSAANSNMLALVSQRFQCFNQTPVMLCLKHLSLWATNSWSRVVNKAHSSECPVHWYSGCTLANCFLMRERRLDVM